MVEKILPIQRLHQEDTSHRGMPWDEKTFRQRVLTASDVLMDRIDQTIKEINGLIDESPELVNTIEYKKGRLDELRIFEGVFEALIKP